MSSGMASDAPWGKGSMEERLCWEGPLQPGRKLSRDVVNLANEDKVLLQLWVALEQISSVPCACAALVSAGRCIQVPSKILSLGRLLAL